MQTNLSTRIIAGKYKGKKIILPSLSVTRGSKSILKESFFNTIQFEIIDKIFIEVFAGSGSMGLEALSRGAKEAHFIELDKNSYKILAKNCKSIAPHNSFLYNADSFSILKSIIDKIDSKKDIILYFDPPFDIRDNMNDIYIKCFNLIKSFDEEFFKIVIEHRTKIDLEKELGNYILVKTKKFGKSSLSYYEYKKAT